MLDRILEQFNSTLADLAEFIEKEKIKRDLLEVRVTQMNKDICDSSENISKAARVGKKIAKLVG